MSLFVRGKGTTVCCPLCLAWTFPPSSFSGSIGCPLGYFSSLPCSELPLFMQYLPTLRIHQGYSTHRERERERTPGKPLSSASHSDRGSLQDCIPSGHQQDCLLQIWIFGRMSPARPRVIPVRLDWPTQPQTSSTQPAGLPALPTQLAEIGWPPQLTDHLLG